MTPQLRRAALVVHVTTSVGWFGAVAAYLALALIGLYGGDPQSVRGAYIAMDLVGWWVIVPLSLASLLSGVVQSLGTSWGLFRHYWVAVKFWLNVVASGLLLLHMQPTSGLADVAARTTLASGDHRAARVQLALDAGAALILLLTTTTLAVFKPRGRTRWGARRRVLARPAG